MRIRGLVVAPAVLVAPALIAGHLPRVGQLIRSFRAITSSATALSGQSWPKA
jgi:hypothetical protein